MTIFSGVFVYYHSKINRTPWDFTPILVIGLLVTRYYGLPELILFVIFANIIPAILGGEIISAKSLVFIAWFFAVNSLILIFGIKDIVNYGVVLIMIEAFGSIFINKTLLGLPIPMSFSISIFTVIIRIIYMLSFGRILVFALEKIL